ncbi:hypothetical protein FOQG_18106 [Fusarium oxysporum f. sp. raphani 54005]|uniref:Ubiquitin-like protease family profile domain-containing protein n=1 Tax=Fusarium oxysporum f. sp. raphani 54005 TaxID=1089458 RepID=X0B515_FUSOX|nr:hypothetical protein FOQG_18106 [Fusarium oxysporum f. sp. raphani 54005]
MTLRKRKEPSTVSPDTGNEDARLVATGKQKYAEVQSGKKDLLSFLDKASTADHWREWVATLQGAGVKTLKALSGLVKYAMSQKIDAGDLLRSGRYGCLDREFQNVSSRRKLSADICHEALKQLQNEVGEKSQNDANLGTITEAGSGMDAELPAASDDDARNSKSTSPETSPRQGPYKGQKRTPERIDITPDTPPHEKRRQRQDGTRWWNETANKVISQMNQNVMLTDDVLTTLSEVLMSYRESEARLVDTYQFQVDGKEIPSKLKRPPERGEKLYALLHHPSDGPHWTLCVLMFEDKFIRLDFYDSLNNEARACRVKSFFTDWINEQYHGSNLQFAIREAPQQNDGTSCGIFALEIMKRLLASDDANQPIEPMEVRRALLQRMTSVDTTSSLPLQTHTLEILRSIQKHFPIRAFIDKISDAAGPKEASFANLLRQAEEQSAQATEEINGLERKLKDAQDSLLDVKTEAEFIKKGLGNFSRFIATNETADFSVAMHSGITGDEPVADGSLEPSAKRPRMSQSAMDFTQGLNNLMSQFEHKHKEETNKMLQESMDKTLDEVRKRVEEAEKKEKELTEQLKHLQSHADLTNAITSLYWGFSHLQNIGVDIRAIASDIIRRQAR